MSNALSAIARPERVRLLPSLTRTNSSMTSRQVRLVKLESAPARYALAIWRFNTGWRSDWFLASMIRRASSSSCAPKLVRLP